MIKRFLHAFLFVIVLFLVSAAYGVAQQTQITGSFRADTIDTTLQLLKAKYAYPEIALAMERAIRERQQRGEYDSLTDGKQFAEKLTADLRAVFDDKHLKVSYSAKSISAQSGAAGVPSAEEIEAARRKQRRENFGFQKVEILKGNIGLIQINYFAPLDWSAATITAAMNVVTDTDALIIDVRENRGSHDINTIPFFCSYLFDKPVQVGDVVSRETNDTRQLWTYASVQGRKYVDKPVFLLTSGTTASGAEAFVGHLKRLKRAVVVGETTQGATMPGGSHRVNEHFTIWISTGRSATGSAANENKGLIPDVPVSRDKALGAAYRLALGRVLQNDTEDEWKEELKQLVSRAEAEQSEAQ